MVDKRTSHTETKGERLQKKLLGLKTKISQL